MEGVFKVSKNDVLKFFERVRRPPSQYPCLDRVDDQLPNDESVGKYVMMNRVNESILIFCALKTDN